MKKNPFKQTKIIVLCISLILTSVVLEVFAKEHQDSLGLYAKSAVLMDADSGRVLYGKEEEKFLANASTTKIMTCILAIESGSLDETVTVSQHAASMPKVHLWNDNQRYLLIKRPTLFADVRIT